MILINANKPINQADEIRQKEIQRRYEQRFFGEFRMQRDRNHFRDQRRDAQQIANPDARKRGQCPGCRLLLL